MTKQNHVSGLVAVEPVDEITVLSPDSGFLERILKGTGNMLKARAMRMTGLLRRINASGRETEALLRMAADRMEVAQAKFEKDLVKEGLLPSLVELPTKGAKARWFCSGLFWATGLTGLMR